MSAILLLPTSGFVLLGLEAVNINNSSSSTSFWAESYKLGTITKHQQQNKTQQRFGLNIIKSPNITKPCSEAAKVNYKLTLKARELVVNHSVKTTLLSKHLY